MAAKQSPFGRVVLISGPESLLADRAVDARVAAATAERAEAEVRRVAASELDAGQLAEMMGGSLFSSTAVVVIRDLANLPADLHEEVARLARDPLPEIALVLEHGGGNKGKGLLDKVKKAGAEVVQCAALRPHELSGFVTNEVRTHRARIDPEATNLLIDSVGHDLRSLAAAVSQLVSDGEGGQITTTEVRRYFGGRAEVTSFAVADEALAGNTEKALEQLRWALTTGVAPLLVTSALANGLRALGRLLTMSGGLRDADLAREVGVPPWKLRTMRSQLRGWHQGSLATAISAVARADAEVKGAAGDPAYALERCVLTIASARAR